MLTTPLSASQLRLAALVHAGRTTAQIARETELSHGAVRMRLSRLYERLGVEGRVQLALWVERRRQAEEH